MEELDLGQTVRGFSAGQQLFGRYVLQSILGRGGMGVVWRAYDEQLECEVALKFLPEMVAFDEQAIADLKRETKKTRDLRHHHIVQVYDFVTDKHAACISMEYVDGLTLSAIKARDPRGHLEVEEISTWVEQLCEALSYAHHRARVVHRDLKPANLMLNSRGELKVTDFGIARSLSDSVSMLTMARGTSGTLLYMSPQQLDGERASHLDDIYSLGATIYELLTGRPPFYSGAVERQVHEKTAPAISQRRNELDISSAKEVPAPWEQTITACLAKDPAQRPQSAGEVARCLGIEHLSRSVVEEKAVPPSSPPEALPRPPRAVHFENRKTALAAALGILLAVTALGGWWFGIQQPRRNAEHSTEAEKRKLEVGAKAAEEKKRFDDEVKVTAAAQLAAEKRRADDATALAAAAAKKRKEGEAQNIANASKAQPFENGLGMKFVPVPIRGGPTSGKPILFSVWETRVRDFAQFIEESGRDMKKGEAAYTVESDGKGGSTWKQAGGDWRDPRFPAEAKQTDDHPVVCVSWEDALAFSDWLTEREHKAGRLPAEWSYRLQSDHEWSSAVGIGEQENASQTPEAKVGKIKNVYPWGKTWPPPRGAGNYCGEESRIGVTLGKSWSVIEGYRDGAPRTSAAGQYEANEYGMYDLGGNAWEWCSDKYKSGKAWLVLRGASWGFGNSDYLLSSHRVYSTPSNRYGNFGFRVVVAGSAPAR